MTQPAYTATAPYYEGRTSDLLSILTAESRLAPIGTWAHRQLRQGPTVSVSMRADGRRLVKLAQAERPIGIRGLDEWHRTVELYAAHLGLADWEDVALPPGKGYAIAAAYLEPERRGKP